MRAGALFSSADQRAADPAAIASGLLALTRLDHADLAVALLVDLWSDGDENAANKGKKVADETAVLVIDAALKSTAQPALNWSRPSCCAETHVGWIPTSRCTDPA
ncbi:MAG: hypothetical protein ACRDSP_16165 [Pseudonocardiaceae bacterium]